MITIITGVPGMGKTAMLVHILLANEKTKFSSRPVFVMGINNLLIDHAKAPPVEEWTEKRPSEEDPTLLLDYYRFPPNSILVVDEAQRVFRTRSSGSKVPNHVAALETHRHTGLDIILLTQKPQLLDANARLLCGRHVHIKNTIMGRKLFEWFEFTDVENRSNLDAAVKRSYSPPKEVFSLYKSAEVHTKQPRRLHQIWIYFSLALMALSYFGYKIYNRINEKLYDRPDAVQVVDKSKPMDSLKAKMNGALPERPQGVVVALKTAVVNSITPPHPYQGFDFRILGTAVNFKKQKIFYYRLTASGSSLDLNSNELKTLGYEINSPNDCSSFMFYKGAHVVATCSNSNSWQGEAQPRVAMPALPPPDGIIKGETLDGGFSIPPNTAGMGSRSSPNGAPVS